jgi:hypothetical protein
MSKVSQIGLFTTAEDRLEAFADRVSNYNKSKGFVVVEMEGRPSPPDEICPVDHWKINLEFLSRGYAKDFWTDPEYQTNIIQ